MTSPVQDALDAYIQNKIPEIAELVAEKLRDDMPEAQTDPLRRIEEVARQLGIHPRSVRDMVNGRDGGEPKLASLTVGPGKGARVVRQSTIDAYIAEQERR